MQQGCLELFGFDWWNASMQGLSWLLPQLWWKCCITNRSHENRVGWASQIFTVGLIDGRTTTIVESEIIFVIDGLILKKYYLSCRYVIFVFKLLMLFSIPLLSVDLSIDRYQHHSFWIPSWTFHLITWSWTSHILADDTSIHNITISSPTINCGYSGLCCKCFCR